MPKIRGKNFKLIFKKKQKIYKNFKGGGGGGGAQGSHSIFKGFLFITKEEK